jgi:cytochrome c oxidase subunit 3
MDNPNQAYPGVDPPRAGLSGHCPRCGKGRLFAGYLRLERVCSRCGLDLAALDSADGPAFFVMSIVSFVVVGLALYTEVSWSPPIYVHILLWVPLAFILAAPLMRIVKGLMVGLQFRSSAAEGRLHQHDDE